MNKSNCSIVKDLLPLYVEKLTSDESNQLIEEHIKNCSSCLKEIENHKKINMQAETAKLCEINFMKKYYDYRKKLIVSLAILLICFVSVLALIFVPTSIPSENLILTDVKMEETMINETTQPVYVITVEYPAVFNSKLKLCSVNDKNSIGISHKTNLLGYLQFLLSEPEYISTTYRMSPKSTLYFCDNNTQKLIFNQSINPNDVVEPSRSKSFINFIF